MIREIPSLSLTLLKLIAKAPQKYIRASSIERAFKICPENIRESSAQILSDYIAEAGRLTDEVGIIFPTSCTKISIRNSKLSSRYINQIVDRCKNLVELDISGCFQVTDETIRDILTKCPKLTSLNLRNCRKVTDLSLRHTVEYGKKLIELHIGGNFNITANGIRMLLLSHSNMSNFKAIHLSGLPVTEEHIGIIQKKTKYLTSVSFAYATLSELCFKQFIHTVGSRLESICIGWTTTKIETGEHVSNSVLEFLVSSCPRLVIMDISGLKNVTASFIQQLVDIKINKALLEPDIWLPLQRIIAKFSGVTRIQLEQLTNTYTELKIEA
mmetsp:Transcript_5277/g.5419  ORF Transcript_5277/g.5419 Transcript_5277/m.5419 type:complete len:327 (+) Transcript_5277:197-1177(+)